MSVPHDSNNGLLHVCLLTIENIPLTLDNIKTKLLNMKKHLSYDDIVLVEFNASYYPQCLYDVAHIGKRVQLKERFKWFKHKL